MKYRDRALVGITMPTPHSDLGNAGEILDGIEALGVDSIELRLHDMYLIHAGRVHLPLLKKLSGACQGRDVVWTIHGPKSINFFDDPERLPLHLAVLEASLDIAAEVESIHLVLHSGRTKNRPASEIETRYEQQRDWLRKAGDLAATRGQLLCVETMIGGSEGLVHTATPVRLADEISAIDHPSVRATLDFSHARQRVGFYGGDFIEEASVLAPYANHLHIHDSFGRPETVTTYSSAERLAFGMGDLHLPVGWGDMPWESLMDRCLFPSSVVFNIELKQCYWSEVEACLLATRLLAGSAKFR